MQPVAPQQQPVAPSHRQAARSQPQAARSHRQAARFPAPKRQFNNRPAVQPRGAVCKKARCLSEPFFVNLFTASAWRPLLARGLPVQAPSVSDADNSGGARESANFPADCPSVKSESVPAARPNCSSRFVSTCTDRSYSVRTTPSHNHQRDKFVPWRADETSFPSASATSQPRRCQLLEVFSLRRRHVSRRALFS
ncbi:MAG: hypothetical protein QOE73_1634 [Verrucomicrobiota bacterium]